MSKEEFKKIKPKIQREMEKAILFAMKECPEGFLGFLGMTITPEAVGKIRSM